MANPLTLTAAPGAWRLFATRKADPAFLKFSERVLQRDAHTCQFCGFQAQQHQEVINRDSNYHNNRFSNLITACVFCTQCTFLESVGRSDYGGGTLILLPEISQPELNGFCHVIFCAISNATSYSTEAQAIYRSLKLRAKIVEKELGEGMSSPALLGQLFIESQVKNKKVLSESMLADLRLLPSYTEFGQQIRDWAAAALDELEEE